jgi:hypothetical protein
MNEPARCDALVVTSSWGQGVAVCNGVQVATEQRISTLMNARGTGLRNGASSQGVIVKRVDTVEVD